MQDFLNVLFGLAALVAVLDYFGIKPRRKVDGPKMSLNRAWKLAIMLFLVALSLGLSGYSLYRSRHPKVVEKIIEKPVDRIVEKIVKPDCPILESKPKAQPKVRPKPTAALPPCPSGQGWAAIRGEGPNSGMDDVTIEHLHIADAPPCSVGINVNQIKKTKIGTFEMDKSGSKEGGGVKPSANPPQ
ncbi:MAG TPA: hypothetical protein VH088_12400 [Terriglobales bacterium]|nr:hypothetical protein [Terriglobales bacterium]